MSIGPFSQQRSSTIAGVSVLALIPARRGSKGVARKNLQDVGGTPLVGLAAVAAAAAASVDRVVVSTDDDEIAEAAAAHGAEAPFRRPAELSGDDVGDFPVLAHALGLLRETDGYEPDVVVWLRPTSPLRTAEDVEDAVALLRETGADCVRSVCLAEHHPYWMKRLEGGRLLPYAPGADERSHPRRQELPPVYRLNGAVDVVRTASALAAGEMFPGDMRGYVMPVERSVDVDTPFDLAVARALAG
jgi:CMP-N,N'-diacetyllegionaminic acid synthase